LFESQYVASYLGWCRQEEEEDNTNTEGGYPREGTTQTVC
jgi:hypothetical protein